MIRRGRPKETSTGAWRAINQCSPPKKIAAGGKAAETRLETHNGRGEGDEKKHQAKILLGGKKDAGVPQKGPEGDEALAGVVHDVVCSRKES